MPTARDLRVLRTPDPLRRPDWIPVAEMRFTIHRAHTSMGCQQASRVVARTDTRPGHEIEYWPWLRAFKISYFATSDADAPDDSGFVFEGEVTYWKPVTDVMDPPRASRDGAE